MNMRLLALTALSMALGWRIRGQFGHEIGAAIAGALGAMAIAALSAREDWWRRLPYFALFGGLGWAFGGSMSYMKVVGYCHSSDSATVLYGFAGLFLLGFLWASLGGAGTALPAVLDAERLANLFPALAAVFGAWFLQDIVVDWTRALPQTGGELGARVEPSGGLIRYDGDWLQATVALGAVLVLAAVRRRIDLGLSLVLHLAIGWWLAFAALVLLLGWRLNPPRGDNWAGCVGLFLGLLVFCRRHRLPLVARAAVATGFLGATGFCLGQMLKLALISTGISWGWHAVMEWWHGLFFGVALALGVMPLVRRGPRWNGRTLPAWTAVFSLVFVMVVVPYLNFRKSPAVWLKSWKSLPQDVYGLALTGGFIPSSGFIGWIELVYLAFGAGFLILAVRHLRRPLALLPENPLGKGQLLYLAFLWLATLASYAHELASMQPVTWAMHHALIVNALICSYLLLAASAAPVAAPEEGVAYAGWLPRTVALGLLAAAAASFGGWMVKRSLFGDTHAPYFYMDHIRFGPNHTNDRR